MLAGCNSKGDKRLKAAMEGHTDKRAGEVRSALVLLGVADGPLVAIRFAKEKLLAQGADDSSLAKNKRSEISYR